MNGKVGFVNGEGKLVVQPTFARAAKGLTDGLVAVSNGRHWGYIDSEGQWVIRPTFAIAYPFSEGLAAIVTQSLLYGPSKIGYVDRKGTIVIPREYEAASSFSEGLAGVQRGPKWGFIDRRGEIVVDFKYDAVGPFQDGLAPVCAGTALIPVPDPRSASGTVLQHVGGKCGYIDRKGNVEIAMQFDDAWSFQEGLASVRVGDRFAFINREGRVVIPARYTLAYDFEDGLAPVQVEDGKMGYIDPKGQWVIEPQFDEAESFSEERAVVANGITRRSKLLEAEGGKWGYIDRTGKLVVGMKYDNAYAFNNGLARITIGDKVGYIDKAGRHIWEPTN